MCNAKNESQSFLALLFRNYFLINKCYMTNLLFLPNFLYIFQFIVAHNSFFFNLSIKLLNSLFKPVVAQGIILVSK